jgi:hypothetical protein
MAEYSTQMMSKHFTILRDLKQYVHQFKTSVNNE